jgi:short-chain Z-isoprenyl diphosphate synthase
MTLTPMVLRDLGRGPVYRLYAHRLRRQVAGGPLPRHVAFLMRVIEQFVAGRLSRLPSWQVHVAGDLDVLPDDTARALKQAAEASQDCTSGRHLTLAVGYGGRQEVVEAFRALLYEHAGHGGTLTGLADQLTASDITRHLYTAGQPDPDLVIRTRGEQRLSNFLLWQSAYSELYFCAARPAR